MLQFAGFFLHILLRGLILSIVFTLICGFNENFIHTIGLYKTRWYPHKDLYLKSLVLCLTLLSFPSLIRLILPSTVPYLVIWSTVYLHPHCYRFTCTSFHPLLHPRLLVIQSIILFCYLTFLSLSWPYRHLTNPIQGYFDFTSMMKLFLWITNGFIRTSLFLSLSYPGFPLLSATPAR